MSKQFLKDAFGWGVTLWLIGYILGMILFAFVPAGLIGWIIFPIGTVLTIYILLKKIKGETLQYYFLIALIWTAIAIIADYFLIVKALNPPDGYYKLDVYLYYALTFLLPLIIGWKKRTK